MNLTIDIPDDQAARFRKQAEAQGLSVDAWLLRLAEQHAPVPAARSGKPTLADVCAKVRGLADELVVERDPSPGRDIPL